ncbi:hypothetical protein J4Q44_G00103830 [Coregonus suidteri]|uniref:Uncharacterized protein n=1 Tax=Coregonus suidteri TaxID=861788 RepID=A0AAN8M165_9TELE
MVVEKLIDHWTPSVLFSDPIVGSEFISERRGGADISASSCTLWRSLTQEDLSSYRKLTKKGGFLHRVWRAVKRITCGCCRLAGARPSLD